MCFRAFIVVPWGVRGNPNGGPKLRSLIEGVKSLAEEVDQLIDYLLSY